MSTEINHLENFKTLVETHISPERASQLLNLITKLGDNFTKAPGSMYLDNNYCFEGGLILQACNTFSFALDFCKLYKKHSIPLDFNIEELTTVCLFSSIGLCEVDGVPFFVPETSDWHKKNMNRGYKFNDDVKFLLASDKTLFLLQKYTTLTYNEYVAIKIQTGSIDESASKYLQIPEKKKVTLGFVLTASLEAARQMISS